MTIPTAAQILALMCLFAGPAGAAETPEQRLVRVAQKLKPISNSQWNEIAGAKTAETYDIQKGDTLWDISKRLFGNAFYWPKIWSLNVGIYNPHEVAPGQKLAFMPGSSEATPKLAPAPDTGAPSDATPKISLEAGPVSGGSGMHEYDKISPEKWKPGTESQALQQNYDQYGIDKELKISIPARFVFRVPAIANDTTIPFLGEIVGSRREGRGLSQHETVFLKSNSQDLQVGTTYSILGEAEFVRERKSDRSGYIYQAVGEVKIVGVKDELYVGVLTKAYDAVVRGHRVYPLLPLISDIKPLPARAALEALVLMTHAGTRNTAQFRFVHFDRGIEDGVQIGNVFRIYDYYDPMTREKLTDSDFLISSDAIIVHATAQFSTALVIRSRDTFTRGDFGVLLTDVSDIERQLTDRARAFGEEDQRAPEDKELDELDELDRTSGEGLGRKEETEIKELDQWDKTKDLQTQPSAEPTVPSAADVPTDEAEQAPTTEPELAPPQEPTLDESLDSPSVRPPGLETSPPPATSAPQPDQTLDAPAPPASEELSVPGEPSSEGLPPVEPIAPETPSPVEPVPTPPEKLE